MKGDIGVLRRDYPLHYLCAAQRAFRGRPLDANEIALARSVQLSMQSEIGGSEDGFGYWRRVRTAYAEAGNTLMPPDIEVFGTLTESEADSSFLNCQDDAFYTAGKHLDELRLRADASPDAAPAGASADVLALRVAGRASADGWLLDWVRGQDAVFNNCAILGGALPRSRTSPRRRVGYRRIARISRPQPCSIAVSPSARQRRLLRSRVTRRRPGALFPPIWSRAPGCARHCTLRVPKTAAGRRFDVPLRQ